MYQWILGCSWKIEWEGKKGEDGRWKYQARSRCHRTLTRKCWNYSKVEDFKRGYQEEKNNNKKENNDYDVEFEKYYQEDGGGASIWTLETHTN